MGLLIGAGILALILFFICVSIYNGLVAVRNHCDEAWANIDTELKRRYDLIPNLVLTVKGYASHEQSLLTKMTELREAGKREQGPSTKKAEIESELSKTLHSFMIRVEAYPDLKASQNFLSLQEELTNTEDRIQAALRFYNGNVRENNNKVEMFPSSVFASTFNFPKRDYFEIQGDFRETPKVSF